MSKNHPSNNFGVARLLLAAMVVVSHSPELLDGDRSREPLTQIFPQISFGTLGIDGFFLISGFLITQSFLSSSSAKSYMLKRVLRIFPGFAVAFLISLLIVGPLGGGQLFGNPMLWLNNLTKLFLLQQPVLPTAFVDTPHAALNGSMWSISYEFRCYIAVMIVGIAGAFAHRNVVLAGTVLIVAASAIIGENVAIWPSAFNAIIGEFGLTLLLLGVYACGVCFYLFRDKIAFTPARCALAALAFVIAVRTPHLGTVAIQTAGAYLLFAFIFEIKNRHLAAVGTTVDLSYGIYLYSFPIQKLTIQWLPGIDPWTLTLVALIASAACAWLSWTFVEKPAVNLRKAIQRRSGPITARVV